MRPHLSAIFALTAAFALSSCTTLPNNGAARLTGPDLIALEELEDLPAKRAVQIQTQFSDGNEILAAPSVVASSGQTAAIEIAAEESYPTRFTLAQAKDASGENVFPVTPAQPTDLTTAAIGLSLECTPEIVGGFIEIKGRIVVRWNEGLTATASVGEGIGSVFTNDQRIVLTDNRHDLPVFGSRTTPFFVRALPGKTYTLIVRGENGPISIDITASLLAPDRGEIADTMPDPIPTDQFLAIR